MGWLCTLGLLLAIPAWTDVADLSLPDQYGAMSGLTDDGSAIQIAIVVSAKRLRRLKPWEQALRDYDDGMALVRVADVPRAAPTEYERVAETLRKRLPEDVNVLIDLEGIWAERFGLDTSRPNILIFDGAGTLLASHAGMYQEVLFEAVRTDLERISGGATAQSP
jgi:hypothetical protein